MLNNSDYDGNKKISEQKFKLFYNVTKASLWLIFLKKFKFECGHICEVKSFLTFPEGRHHPSSLSYHWGTMMGLITRKDILTFVAFTYCPSLLLRSPVASQGLMEEYPLPQAQWNDKNVRTTALKRDVDKGIHLGIPQNGTTQSSSSIV